MKPLPLACTDALRDEAPEALRGVVQLRKTPRPHADRYYLYVPRHWRPERVLVAVHGISRGAREQAATFATVAERYGAAVIAPLFEEDRFPDYQRLGRERLGERADIALQRVVADAAHALHHGIDSFCLFGFSGGGQFVHRYALAHPAAVARMAIAAAGWFTLPDPSEAFPKGLGPCRRLPDLAFDLDRFLAIPTLVVASRRDRKRDATLRRRRSIDATQGRNRVERARRWVRALRRAAAVRGLAKRIRFRSLRHSDHDFADAVRRDHLDEVVCNFFWDESSRMQSQ